MAEADRLIRDATRPRLRPYWLDILLAAGLTLAGAAVWADTRDIHLPGGAREASARDEALQFFHFRDKDGAEVDIVIERGARAVAGVEVKASATVTPADFRGLRKLKEASGKRFAAGVVLYDGEVSASFGDGMFAVPVRALWGR